MSYIVDIRNETSVVNSTIALLGISGVFTGTEESVEQWTTIAVSFGGSTATQSGTLEFGVRQENGTIAYIPYTILNPAYQEPKIFNIAEDYITIRYTNGADAQTGSFFMSTKYSNGQPIDILSVAGGTINETTSVIATKSVITGVLPNGNYANAVIDGSAFSTTTPLASLAVFDSGILDMTGYTQVQTEVSADFDGTLDFTFYEDSAGLDTIRSISVPYVAVNGYQLYSAPSFGYYVRYKFTNTSASLQTDFFFTTKFLTKALSAQVIAKNGYIAPTMTANLIRTSNDFNSDRNVGVIGGQASKRKFGVNTSVGTALETIWSYTANWVPNQVLNEKLRIKAGGNAADDSAGLGTQKIEVTYLNDSWLEVTETIVTNGALESLDSSENCVRLIRAESKEVGTYHAANTGGIIFELTGGNIMGYIEAGVGTTEQALLTIPADRHAYITEIFVSVGQGNSADIKMFTSHNSDDMTTPFQSKQLEWTLEDFSGAQIFKLDTHLKMDALTDIWFESEKITGGGNARVSIDFNYYTVLN